MGALQCAALVLALTVANVASSSNPYFAIHVVDSETGLGVPLVRLSTSTYIDMYTDSAGVVAFFEPGMMDQSVWFVVLTDGYVFQQNKDPPYDPGTVLFTATGGSAVVVVNRTQHAQRMFRLTGAGLYRDSVLVGAPIPSTAQSRAVSDPVTRAAAQDTVMTTVFKSQMFWTFGDTVCVSDARQGNCHATGMYTVGATSAVPSAEDAGAPPELAYYGGNGTIHPMAPILPLSRNTWISALSVVHPGLANETLYATYIKPSGGGGPDPNEYEGVAVWNQVSSQFEQVSRWPSTKQTSLNGAHTVQRLSPADANDGYLYYAGGGVYARVHSSAVGDYNNYQVLNASRDWVPVSPKGVSSPSMGAGLNIGGGTVNWNKFARRYMMLGTGGDNHGVYMAFSHSLVGPFENASMVASHATTGSSCYNGAHLAHMDSDSGQVVYFACTFTAMWSNGPAGAPNSWGACLFGLNGSKGGCSAVVPRYEYNNIVYKVDLAAIVNWTGR